MPTNIWDHAERAAIVATVLNLEIGTRAFVGSVENGGCKKFGVSEDVRNVNSRRSWVVGGREAVVDR